MNDEIVSVTRLGNEKNLVLEYHMPDKINMGLESHEILAVTTIEVCNPVAHLKKNVRHGSSDAGMGEIS